MSETKADFSSVVKRLFWSWLGLLLLAVATKIGWLAVLTIVLTAAMPFVLVVLWLGLSQTGRSIRGWFKLWHVRVIFGALVFCYATYGHKWALDIINQLFNVDPKYFGITSTVLTVLFIPFGIIYRPEITERAWDVVLVATVFLTPIYWLYLCFIDDVEGRGLKFLYSIALPLAGVAALTLAVQISNDFRPMVQNFAIWADFNDNHLCTDPWASNAKEVVFLDHGEVLAHFPRASPFQFQVVSCNYAKKF